MEAAAVAVFTASVGEASIILFQQSIQKCDYVNISRADNRIQSFRNAKVQLGRQSIETVIVYLIFSIQQSVTR